MMKQVIKSASGMVIGYLEEQGNRILAQGKSGETLGWFDKNSNKTFDKSGRAVYSGNQTVALLSESH